MKKIALAVSMFAVMQAQADVVNGIDPYAAGYGFDTPAEASLGWLRGDADTLYAEWDVFGRTSPNHLGDVAAAGNTAYVRTAPTIVSGSQNLYAFGGDHKFKIAVDTSSIAKAGNRKVALQIETIGNTIKENTFSIKNAQGVAVSPFSVVKTYQGKAESSFGTTDLTSWMLVWNDIDVANFANFSIEGISAVHSSLTQIALDIGNVSEVPVPAAAWLFGSALLGLAGIKRK